MSSKRSQYINYRFQQGYNKFLRDMYTCLFKNMKLTPKKNEEIRNNKIPLYTEHFFFDD